MAELPFPSSGGVFEAFLERVRFSPQARIDITWLVDCLGISQRANAGRTLRWLEAAGILDDYGLLTPRGKHLLRVPSDMALREAALEALEALVGDERVTKLRSGKLSKAKLRDELQSASNVGATSANKALVGLCVLAEASGDKALISVLGKAQYQKHLPTWPPNTLQQAKKEILSKFKLFTAGIEGIDGWLNKDTPDKTFARLMEIPQEPLSAAQLNQLLTLAHAPPLVEGFFQYYWLDEPPHTYNIQALPCYRDDWDGSLAIFHLDQLYWGFYRFYVDALLYFGNIRAGYQVLRSIDYDGLVRFFGRYRYKTELMISRGPALPLREIAKDDRYLISEMACKSYAPTQEEGVSLETALREAYLDHQEKGGGPVTVGQLLNEEPDTYITTNYKNSQKMFVFSADEILDYTIRSESALIAKLGPIKERFSRVRAEAVENTKLYLSAVGELDVYVATSMRKRADFHSLADFCEEAFMDRRLRRYNLRYFDPTVSAATNHQDKGLIECLMVNCAKVLIYTAGEYESYGKDAEAAMALSLGRPVIFYCSSEEREKFYKDVHPLSKLVAFDTGVAVGAMVTDSIPEVIEVLDRLFTNSMQYSLEQKGVGYFLLKDTTTESVVRLQTDDPLLRETFWNHYQRTRERSA